MQDINNPQLSYYLTHGISPVHQDISDLKLHFARREKLAGNGLIDLSKVR